jgi:acetaldehyde dehydrogenase
MVAEVAEYVPGYRLKQDVLFSVVRPAEMSTLVGNAPVTHQVSVFLEVEGAAHYLPAYAGNLDIMTSAALRAAERIAALQEVGS